MIRPDTHHMMESTGENPHDSVEWHPQITPCPGADDTWDCREFALGVSLISRLESQAQGKIFLSAQSHDLRIWTMAVDNDVLLYETIIMNETP